MSEVCLLKKFTKEGKNLQRREKIPVELCFRFRLVLSFFNLGQKMVLLMHGFE